jgi:hypothetical protein
MEHGLLVMYQMSDLRGVCTGCQCLVSVRFSTAPRLEMKNVGYNDWDLDMQFGESINYLCSEHDFCGERCDGSTLCPQAIVK